MASNSRPGLSLIEDEYWYAGPISERKSEQILSERGEAGSFLVRDSLLPEADYVLSVSSGKEIWHYDVKVMPNNECVFNNYAFSSLPDAIEFYMENRLGSVFLKEPKEPVVSPVDISKPAAPVIKKVVSGTALQPRTTPVLSSSKPSKAKLQNVHNNVDLSKLDEHPWQGQDGSQAGYSPALSHSSNRSPESGMNFSSTSFGDEVRSQGSSKSSRSQTSEVDTSYILPSNNIESVFIKPANSEGSDRKENTAVVMNPAEKKPPDDETLAEFCETSFDSDLDETGTKSEESTLSKNDQALPNSPNTPGVVKPTTPSNKADELKQLPSISGKMFELEKRSKGESGTPPATKQKRPKSPLPPPLPKRVSSISNMKTSTGKSHEMETEPTKGSTKTDNPPPPKRLSIPEMFLEKPGEEQNSLPPPKSPGAQAKRIEIPSSLELMPPPPPLATHPGLATKMKEEEDKEKLQPQMGKKRGGFMKLKKRNSKREKDKRTSLTEEPTLLGSEGSNKNSSPTQVSSPRRLSGVPTPALSPGAVGGEGAELESKFKSITKQKWNPETFEPNDIAAGDHDLNTSALTFGHPSPSPHKQSGHRAPSVTSESQTPTPVSPNSMTTSPAPAPEESVNNKQGSDDIDGNEPLKTFLPSKKTQSGVSNGVQREENGIAAVTIAAPNNSSNRNSSSNIAENGVHIENGTTGAQSNSLADIVPAVKQQVTPVSKSPARSPRPKHQMPPGFMLVAPTQPLPQQFTTQRRLPPTHEQPSKKPAPKPAATAAAPGPMNTKRSGGLRKKKSFIFRK